MNNDPTWLDIEQASELMHRSARQVRRYAEAGRIRTRKRGVRVLYHLEDVQLLADELPQDTTPKPRPPTIMPSGEMLTMIEQLRHEVEAAAVREGILRTQLDQRPALADQQALLGQLAQVQNERDVALARLETLQSSGRRLWLFALVVVLILGITLIVMLLVR